jgi:hypothetical protein
MSVRRSFIAIWLAVFLGRSFVLCAQEAKTLTLDEILERLEANLGHYDNSLPSLFCDEHAVSRVEPSAENRNTVTESVFRLKRTPGPNHTTNLVESRDIKSVNGRAPSSEDLKGPSLLTGAFEGGFDVVSLNQKACMSYELERAGKNGASEPYIVRFKTSLNAKNASNCLLQEKSKGRVVIDPVSMQITRMELTTPHHTIFPGTWFDAPVVGEWTLTIDYAPVVLGGETFWMPSTITSRAISGGGTFHSTVWTFEATYSNYHRLEVNSRILPGSEAAVP